MAIGIKHGALALLLASSALAAAAQDTAKPDAARPDTASASAGAPIDGVDGVEERARLRRGEHAVEPSTSVAQADVKLADVKAKRAVVEATFADSERTCYTKFFVNYCLDQAKEIRRAALVDLRAVEIEASHYKRAESVDRRDRALAEQNQTAAAQLSEREAKPVKAPKAPVPATQRKPATQTLAQRKAEHDAKLRQLAEREAANAGKRAANEASYAKNQAESIKRQQKVAEKQAEKAEKERKSAADKAASAAAAAKKNPN